MSAVEGRMSGESESKDTSTNIYSPEADVDRSSSSDGCSLLWRIAWCPILQGKCQHCYRPLLSALFVNNLSQAHNKILIFCSDSTFVGMAMKLDHMTP